MNAFTSQKERNKKVRVVFEVLVILFALFIVIRALFTFVKYVPYNDNAVAKNGDQGFIALSYFGVDRTGNASLIGMELLDQHLTTLKERGYVTITQQDILDYYQKGKTLPAKSLFLMFEDGRRDTAIFSQKILEKDNFIATCMTYPEKFDNKDTKFLMPDELKKLQGTTFWEMGTNGYRLYFINVFDRYNNYLGNMGPLEHSMVQGTLGRKYNHYLMDYIRDEHQYPLESYQVMKARVDYDYERLRDIYTSDLGYVPQAYVLMHSNTGSFGNNEKVAAANKYWIEKLFKMNFNREGYSKNVHSSSLYDLTRMEPQAYWPVNHLLTRINDDTNQKLKFVDGEPTRYAKWMVMEGAAELQPERIILTTKTKDKGRMNLKGSDSFHNFSLTVDLLGNKYGQQNIYLRGNEDVTTYVSVGIVNNFLIVTDCSDGTKKELLKLNLDRFDGLPVKSVDEDKRDVVKKELETFTRYADSAETAKIYVDRLKDKEIENPKTVADGAKEYVPELSYHARGNRHLEISLLDKTLSIKLDGKALPKKFTLAKDNPGRVSLEAAWGGYGWSQINLADDVYDGVFGKLVIKDAKNPDTILYDDSLRGWEAVKFRAYKVLMAVVEWFIKNL